MKKRVIAALLTASMAVGLLAGCGSSGGDSGGESKEAGKQGKEASLRFIDVNPSPERQKYYEGVFQKFEEETGISVAYESVPWDDAADKLTVLGTSGQLPDVITTHPSWTVYGS